MFHPQYWSLGENDPNDTISMEIREGGFGFFNPIAYCMLQSVGGLVLNISCWDYDDFGEEGNMEQEQTYYIIMNSGGSTYPGVATEEVVWNHPGLNPIAMENFDDTNYPLDPTLNPTIYSFTIPRLASAINTPPRSSSPSPGVIPIGPHHIDYININTEVDINDLIFTDDKQIGKVKSVEGNTIKWKDRQTGKLHKSHKTDLRFVKDKRKK